MATFHIAVRFKLGSSSDLSPLISALSKQEIKPKRGLTNPFADLDFPLSHTFLRETIYEIEAQTEFEAQAVIDEAANKAIEGLENTSLIFTSPTKAP